MSRPRMSASIVRLPARLQAAAGIAVARAGGKDTIRQDWTNLGTIPPPATPANYEFLIRDISTGALSRVSGDAVFPISGSSPRNTAQGRLTLSATQPITTADISAGTTAYYLASGGQLLPIWNSSAMAWLSIGGGLTLPLDPDISHTNYHAANFNFDFFAILDAGIVRLVTGPTWAVGAVPSPDITKERATGANSTELTIKDGIIVNKNSFTVRKGTAAGDTLVVQPFFATYLGSFKATANGTATDTRRQRLLYNAYNQAPRSLYRVEGAGAWDWSVSTYRQMNANALNQVEVLFGLDGGLVDLSMKAYCLNSTSTAQNALFGIGVDSLVTPSNFSNLYVPDKINAASTRYVVAPGLGFHFFSMLERGAGVGGQTQFWQGGDELYGQVLL